MYSRRFLNSAFEAAAEEQIGMETDDGRIRDLTLRMMDRAVGATGQIGRTTRFGGPIFFGMCRGTTLLHTNAAGVSARPRWWRALWQWALAAVAITASVKFGFGDKWTLKHLAKKLKWNKAASLKLAKKIKIEWFVGLTPLYFNIKKDGVPLLRRVSVLKRIPPIAGGWGDSRDYDSVPDRVRSDLASRLGRLLLGLASALGAVRGEREVTCEATPDALAVNNGHFLFMGQADILPSSGTIVAAYFSRLFGRYVEFELDGGRRLRGSELARLVLAEKIETPGFHAVRSTTVLHMRTNPGSGKTMGSIRRFADDTVSPP